MVVLGLLLRFGTSGAVADASGGILYAVLVYLLIGLLRPDARPRSIALIALGICLLVEGAQITGIPAELGERLPISRLILGSTFSVNDLFTAAAGALLAPIVDFLISMSVRRFRTHARP